jgi:hypothetical protein
MPPKKANVLGAMFDVKPVNESGGVDVAKISSVISRVNLRQHKKKSHSAITLEYASAPAHSSLPVVTPMEVAPVTGMVSAQATREGMLKDLEHELHQASDPLADLVLAGASFQKESRRGKPRIRPIAQPSRTKDEDKQHKQILSEIYKPAYAQPQIYDAPLPSEVALASAPVVALDSYEIPENPYLKSAELEVWLDDFKERSRKHITRVSELPRVATVIARVRAALQSRRTRLILASSLVAMIAGTAVYGLVLKHRIIQEGNAAVQNLEHAKASLANLDFAAASNNFLSAYQSFSRAGEQLNFMGANIGSLLSDLPGGGTLKSAQNLVEVGKLMADTGQAMAHVVDAVAKTGAILNPAQSSSVVLSEVIQPLTEALIRADANFKKAGPLLASIDASILPAEKQDTFTKFKDQFPQFQSLVGDGVEYAKFLETLIGVKGSKKYLLLFQNYSELRPTGGFPGSYALVTFENGKLKEMNVDDIYNPDGQLKELIVPPQQLQHITPTWAMRDAGWFIDFPTSARKVASFYKKETSNDVDGVVTISPQIIIDILKIVGPIDMPEYKVTITPENFLAEVQSEVEYGDNKKINKPKKIITDLAPILLQRLYSANHDTWLTVFNSFLAGMERRDIMMYFKDLNLESFALDKGYAGEVKRVPNDYLMVTATNVKGSKADLVTDSVIKEETFLEDGAVHHKLTITRTHNGGRNKYGFYNKQNPSFIRVLVPKGSRFLGITGNTQTNFKPLVDYAQEGFVHDEDLAKFEKTFHHDELRDVATYDEADKTGFAFWMVTDPGTSSTVELEYSLPESLTTADYRLYVQKQPGLAVKNFQFSFAKPQGMEVTATSAGLQRQAGAYTMSGELAKDLEVGLTLK